MANERKKKILTFFPLKFNLILIYIFVAFELSLFLIVEFPF